MKKATLAAFVFLATSTTAFGQVTADQLTCAELRADYKRDEVYWKATPYDGPIPIYGINYWEEGMVARCTGRKRIDWILEQTLDTRKCLVGYRCISA